jgi:putative transposase
VNPRVVLFDAWYPSRRVLKRIGDYGWSFVCQLKRNRRFEGRPLKGDRQQPYWPAVGMRSGGLKGRVVKSRRTSFATNRVRLTAPEVRAIYARRHESEEVSKALQDQWSLEACQAGDTRSYARQREGRAEVPAHHLALGLVAYLIVERERLTRGLTFRQLRRTLIVKGQQVSLPSLQCVRTAA